jgi:hypothetical protein
VQFLFFLNFFIVVSAQSPLQQGDLWRICTQDSDCVREAGICDSFVSINKKFTAEFKAFRKKQMATIDCQSSPGPEDVNAYSKYIAAEKQKQQLRPSCQANKCELR